MKYFHKVLRVPTEIFSFIKPEEDENVNEADGDDDDVDDDDEDDEYDSDHMKKSKKNSISKTTVTNLFIPNSMIFNGIALVMNDSSTCQETQIGKITKY